MWQSWYLTSLGTHVGQWTAATTSRRHVAVARCCRTCMTAWAWHDSSELAWVAAAHSTRAPHRLTTSPHDSVAVGTYPVHQQCGFAAPCGDRAAAVHSFLRGAWGLPLGTAASQLLAASCSCYWRSQRTLLLRVGGTQPDECTSAAAARCHQIPALCCVPPCAPAATRHGDVLPQPSW